MQNKKNNSVHIPVLGGEVIDFLQIKPDGVYVDCTINGGGHAGLILEKLNKDGFLVGIDRDKNVIRKAEEKFSKEKKRVTLIQGHFGDIGKLLNEKITKPVNGFLFDLGVSSHQLNEASRGFSYRFEGPLDMRMDQSSGKSASELLKSESVEKITEILGKYADITRPKFIASLLTAKELLTTTDLKNVLEEGFGKKVSLSLLSRIFMAIRIFVNDEFKELKSALNQCFSLLAPGGVVAVISYHSGEDRITKKWMKDISRKCICPPELPVCVCDHKQIGEVLTKKPIRPKQKEIKNNIRARSALLRCVQRI